MANFTPSNLVAGQALFLDNYKSGEWRMPDTAVLAAMYAGVKANPSLASLRKREDRSVYGYLPIRRSKGSATERLYNHTGNRGDSKQVSLSWNSIIETFSISIKQNDNNIIPFEENYAAQLNSAIYNVLERQESAILALLLAGRTQIHAGRLNGTWNSTDYVMEILNDYSDRFFENVAMGMRNNLFRSNLMIIADSLAWMNSQYGQAQGAGNGTNLGYQYNNMTIMPTTNVIDDDYVGAALAFPMDLAGIVPWIPVQNRKTLDPDKAMSYNGDFGMVSVPIYDANGNQVYSLDFAIHAYAERADTSASNGSKQDIVMQVEVSLDLAYVSAPLSSLRATGDFAGKTDTVVYQFGLSA
jgi:hypothetical protein